MARIYGNAALDLSLAILLACAHAPSAAAQEPAIAVPVPQSNKAPGQPSQSVAQQGSERRGAAKSAATVSTATALDSMEPPITPAPGTVVDQVIGVVNGDLVLESDVEEERRFEAFEPFSTPGGFSRDRSISRLVDRALILQQAKLQPDQLVTLDDAKKQLESLRKDLPACKAYRCETDAGWEKFVHDQGFTQDELTQRWQQRMEILKFIEMRFRAGIDITPAEIKDYYEKTMLPEYSRVGSTPPKLAVISERIQEVLLEQRVSSLLSDWLLSLKAQGNVRMMRPGEVLP